ncbi:MAG: prepilin-type N-terminal cleavage/methylation domain-containing protein [Gemmatimonadota bacterium]
MTCRRGATLIEAITALAIGGVLAATLVRTLDRSARLHTGTISLVEQVTQLSESAAILREMTSELSVPAGALYTWSATNISMAGAVGSSVACRQAASAIELVPDSLTSGQTLSFWNTSPQPGDSISWFDQGSAAGPADDSWHTIGVAAAARSAGNCQGTAFATPADAGQNGWTLQLSAAPSIPAGTPVRVTRPQRLALYRSATSHALGFSDWDPVRGAWHVIQPVTAPLNSPAAAAPGLALSLRDSTGRTSATPRQTSALAASFANQTAHTIRSDGRRRGQRTDSITAFVAFRNRR